MTGVVVAEAVLVVLIGFFAVGLLYSYAGLLRRVARLEQDGERLDPPRAAGPASPASESPPGLDIVGTSLSGDAVTMAVSGVRHDTLVAFLSSGCSTCARFWADLPRAGAWAEGGGTRLVVVTQGAESESPSALASLASPDVVDTIMSSACWQDYRVPGSPYFVLVDGGSGLVRGEGTAMGWDEVFKLMALAEGDSVLAPGALPRTRKPASDAAREVAVDRELLRAGIRPGDPSLYPSRPGGAP